MGYDLDFFGIEVLMLKCINFRSFFKMVNGEYIIFYKNFLIINNKRRRMVLLIVFNVDVSREKKRLELGRRCMRVVLGEMGLND